MPINIINWAECEVQEIAELIRGITYKKNMSSNTSGDKLKPILRANNINANAINFDNLIFIPSDLIKDIQLVKKGDIIFAMSSGSKHLVGKSAQVQNDFDGSFGAFCGLLRTSTLLSNSFIAYVFQESNFRKLISEIAKGSNINNLKREHILEYNFNLPPLKEQHRIVNKIETLFSKLEKGIESLKTAQEQLKLYRQALLKHAFEGKLTEQWRKDNADKLETAEELLTRIKQEREKRYQQQLEAWEKLVVQWEVEGKDGKKPAKPRQTKIIKNSEQDISKLPALPNKWFWLALGENNIDISDGPFGSNLKTSDYVSSGVPVIRLENIGALKFIEEKKTFVSKEKYHKLKRYTVLPDDLVFSSFVTENIRVAIVPKSIKKAINKADCFRVRTYGKLINNKYLVYFLSTRMVYKQVEEFVHGVGRPRINTTQLKGISMPQCSIDEQKTIVNLIEEQLSIIDSLETEITENLKKSQALRQSILKKAFSGKLIPQDPNDEPASELLKRISIEKAELVSKTKASVKKAKSRLK